MSSGSTRRACDLHRHRSLALIRASRKRTLTQIVVGLEELVILTRVTFHVWETAQSPFVVPRRVLEPWVGFSSPARARPVEGWTD